MIDKINVSELLLHCPKGMELDCTMYDNCTFEGIEDVGYIDILVKTPSGIIRLTKEGCYIRHDDYAKCVIFPKGKTTWEGFVPPCQFKVGDRIRRKNGNEEYMIISINDCTYYYRLNGHCTGSLGIQLQDEYELVPNKFDVNTLVAFESRVLIRDTKSQKWSPAIWGFYDSDHQDYQYKLVGCIARYCIPYEGNEHLLGTTDDCDEYFKTWK